VGTTLEGCIFLFEVPTGVVADVYSRRLSIIIGFFLIGAGFIVEGSFPVFGAVLLSQVFWGIGYTFTSGATESNNLALRGVVDRAKLKKSGRPVHIISVATEHKATLDSAKYLEKLGFTVTSRQRSSKYPFCLATRTSTIEAEAEKSKLDR
jgi:hypothetical protein